MVETISALAFRFFKNGVYKLLGLSGIRAILRYPDLDPYPDPGFSDIRTSDILLKIVISGGYPDSDLDP